MGAFDIVKQLWEHKAAIADPISVANNADKLSHATGDQVPEAGRGLVQSVAKAGGDLAGKGAGAPISAALGLAHVLSKPAGSLERTHAAQEQLARAVPVVGPALVKKINQTFPQDKTKISEGDGFDVKGSFGGDLNADGSIQVGKQRVE